MIYDNSITIQEVFINIDEPFLCSKMVSIRKNKIVLLFARKDETFLCCRDHIYSAICILLYLWGWISIEVIPTIYKVELIWYGVVGESPLYRAATTACAEAQLQDPARLMGGHQGLNQLRVVIIDRDDLVLGVASVDTQCSSSCLAFRNVADSLLRLRRICIELSLHCPKSFLECHPIIESGIAFKCIPIGGEVRL